MCITLPARLGLLKAMEIKEKPDLIGSKLCSNQDIYLLMLFPNMISK